MKLKIIGFLLAILISAMANASIHPIKLTVGKLQYSQAKGIFQLTMNFFIDDFEAALKKQYGLPYLNISGNKSQAMRIIQDYTSGRLNLRVHSKTLTFSVKELNLTEANVLQVTYFLIMPNPHKIEEIEITNQLLFEVYDEQVNILHVLTHQNEEKMLRFIPFQHRKKIIF